MSSSDDQVGKWLWTFTAVDWTLGIAVAGLFWSPFPLIIAGAFWLCAVIAWVVDEIFLAATGERWMRNLWARGRTKRPTKFTQEVDFIALSSPVDWPTVLRKQSEHGGH